MAFPFHVKEHKIASQHVREFPRATANSQEDVLWLSVKQYTPVDNPEPQPGDVTIIGAHANGFPKELYEALWADLHAAARRHGFRIRGIWIADVTNQGASGVANEAALGNDPSWHDHPRDLLHLTNVFRHDMPRPIVGLGHSFGGNCLTQLALLHPRLLTSLVLLDPVITKFTNRNAGAGVSPARSSTWRRDLWPSRQAAADSFRKSPFYNAWDPRVLQSWIDHAIRDTPTALFPESSQSSSGATLTTTKHQEVFTFFRPLWPALSPGGDGNNNGDVTISRAEAPDFDEDGQQGKISRDVSFPFYRSEGGWVLKRLPHVRPSVLWVFGEDSDLSTPEAQELKLRTTGVGPGGSGGKPAGKVSSVVMPKMGHLFPMEVPGQCAEHAAAWIGTEMEAWREQERKYHEWTRQDLRAKSTLSDEFVKRVGPLPARNKKKPAETSSKL
ncbi:Alpha/beta hydrolase family-domain-containing protein [Microdochium trichocladiopsis]|uniref:Alpha/beta hydrolase family-domain-containing protein n=1 Tax=Microdochium trichocladiopsis TaxID=1682393 RepID=A0A9P9BU55_9PEZI|nr:Alpha/beta hydrolase family-domain-containing protein [Microdochium trichocladiopsis]KAH7040661.1 Alpha/beta hydrolase family-domain-containing protein [Microdochium trichocladiopsis]